MVGNDELTDMAASFNHMAERLAITRQEVKEHQANLELLEALLADVDCEIANAGDGQETLAQVEAERPEVIVLDWMMPELNGLDVLEVLREPLETGSISIARASRQAEFAADFQLLAAMNPCPCGYLGDREGDCNCSAERVAAYRGKISGPLVDRIDLHVEAAKLRDELVEKKSFKGGLEDRFREAIGEFKKHHGA